MTPTGDDSFFEQRREWSKYKHAILGKYLYVWVSKLSSKYRELAFVDTCAGEGRYDDGAEGSPLIASRMNDQKLLKDKGGRLIVHACESRKKAALRLKAALDSWTSRDPPVAIVYNKAFESVLPELIRATHNMPTLFFIDPYGAGGLTTDTIRPILDDAKRAPTELFLRVDPVLFARFAGWLRKKPRDQRGQRTAASFKRLLNKFVDADHVAEALDLDNKENAFDEPMATALFEEYLTMFYDRFKYVQLIPIRPDYFAAPKYYMVHATDSPDGAAKINDAASTTLDTLFTTTLERRSAKKSPGQTDLFGAPQREPRVTIAHAKAHVLKVLGDEQEHPFVNVCADLAMEFGPDLREKHHKKAIKELLAEEAIRRVGEGEFKRSTTLWLTSAGKKLGRR